ncbi:hypothetical protein [Streptomyces sp. F001]|uniref:hypothetical protein n=1 Tax=Streptomyces sp. F001 TaxID=1510026 RepID=UPI00101E45A8|nr:hypothetical protein [Streptomyces sp. F001]
MTDQVSGAPSWPNMHEALMELHEILREWCEAAKSTSKVVELVIAEQPDLAKAQRPSSNFYSGPTPFRRTVAKRTRREIEALMSPPAPVAQRWSGTKRRQAARRTLRSLMHIYCPDLLSDFDSAVEARANWVEDHHAEIRKVLKNRAADGEFAALGRHMTETAEMLESVRVRLSDLIQQRYPLGTPSD